MYAIIDIETNGSSLRQARITEIAIFLFDGQRVVDSFVSLVNPETPIPPYITRLTGISDEMVAAAPRFYEIARKVVEMTEGAVFVAHSARFDYTVIRQEFRRLGYDYQREVLCTVRLSRQLIPLQPSYSLGRLCAALGIPLSNRHRAGGDAAATVALFKLLLQLDSQRVTFGSLKRPPHTYDNPNIPAALIDSLPAETGIYYFYNSDRQLIYIGKSTNIRKRVVSHLLNARGARAIAMRNEIADIDYELTGSELVALLRESAGIKARKPLYNLARKRTHYPYGLFTDLQIDGYLRLVLRRVYNGAEPLTVYAARRFGIEHLYELNDRYGLCLAFTGLHKGHGPCFYFSLKKCRGACTGRESPESYNERVQQALAAFRLQQQNMLIIDKGRNLGEKAVVQVKNGRYVGYGYTGLAALQGDKTRLLACIEPQENNRDVLQIIQRFVQDNKAEQIIGY